MEVLASAQDRLQRPLARGPRRNTIALQAGHHPVLCSEVMELLAVPRGGCVVDATIGLAGHAQLLLDSIGPQGLLIGLDADAETLELASRKLGSDDRCRLFHANFENVEQVLREAGVTTVDTVLADLGISSPQLDDSSRGFSFTQDGPLDMRIDRQARTTAAELVNGLSQSELADLIYEHGQERASRRIARAIHQARRENRITRTGELSDIVCRALKQAPDHHRGKIHPATRTFMALRIAVNRELEALERFVQTLPNILKPGGRAGVISFHSLEDGICKKAFRRMKADDLVELVTKKPVTSSTEERRSNPRSRSAKLRVIQRTSKD